MNIREMASDAYSGLIWKETHTHMTAPKSEMYQRERKVGR
jgi:hypothetical protein